MKRFYSDVIRNSGIQRITIDFVIWVTMWLWISLSYHLRESISFFDGFYMTFITLTTVGFFELFGIVGIKIGTPNP